MKLLIQHAIRDHANSEAGGIVGDRTSSRHFPIKLAAPMVERIQVEI